MIPRLWLTGTKEIDGRFGFGCGLGLPISTVRNFLRIRYPFQCFYIHDADLLPTYFSLIIDGLGYNVLLGLSILLSISFNLRRMSVMDPAIIFIESFGDSLRDSRAEATTEE